MPGGRPTKYRKEYCEQVVEWGKLGKSKTWIACEIGVLRETLEEWGSKHTEFSVALRRAKQAEQKYWEDLGEQHIVTPGFSANTWGKNMSCRFPTEWREKSEVKVDASDAFVSLWKAISTGASIESTE